MRLNLFCLRQDDLFAKSGLFGVVLLVMSGFGIVLPIEGTVVRAAGTPKANYMFGP